MYVKLDVFKKCFRNRSKNSDRPCNYSVFMRKKINIWIRFYWEMFILYFFRVQHESIKILTKWRLNIYTVVHFFHFVFFQSIGNQLSQISILTITIGGAVSRHCPKGSLSSNAVFSFPFSYSIFSWQISRQPVEPSMRSRVASLGAYSEGQMIQPYLKYMSMYHCGDTVLKMQTSY